MGIPTFPVHKGNPFTMDLKLPSGVQEGDTLYCFFVEHDDTRERRTIRSSDEKPLTSLGLIVGLTTISFPVVPPSGFEVVEEFSDTCPVCGKVPEGPMFCFDGGTDCGDLVLVDGEPSEHVMCQECYRNHRQQKPS